MSNKVQIAETLENGGVHFQAILEMVGKPKEHVLSTFTEYVKRIKEDDEFVILSDKIEDVMGVEESESMFSTFCEMEILVKKPSMIYDFCFKYMPASVEILGPEKFSQQATEFTGVLNDFIAKMHTVEMEAKNQKQQIRVLGTNLNVLATNLVLLMLKSKPVKVELMAKLSGIEIKQLQKLLDLLVEQGKIKKEGDLYANAG